MKDLKSTLEHYFPENSIGPGTGKYKGQCAVFAEAVFAMPMPGNVFGNSLESKKNKVIKYGILAKNLKGDFRVGDVIVEKYNPYGHVCIVNSIDGNYLQLSESNFRNDHIVHHTRILRKTDPKIVGVVRGTLKLKPL